MYNNVVVLEPKKNTCQLMCLPYSTCIVIVMTTFFFPQSTYHPYMKGNIWKILLVESRILGFGIRNTSQGNLESLARLESRIQVPLTRSGIQHPGMWNPASKTVLDFLTWGNQEFLGIIYFCLRLSDSEEFLEIPFSNYREIWHLMVPRNS